MIPFILTILGGYLIGDACDCDTIKMADGGKVDMDMLQMDLKSIKNKYPNAKVSYTLAKDSSGKGYVITAKENNKVVYSSYKMADGGSIAESNNRMLRSKTKEIKHHAEELNKVVKPNTDVEGWVVAKAERSASDLSDITHYLDGFKKEFADGGPITDEATISNIRTNIMGTISFDLKMKGMRKAQDFIVYPIKPEDAGKPIMVQSDTRIGLIDLETGRGLMSKSHPNGAYFVHYQMDEKTKFILSQKDNDLLKEKIRGSAGPNVGTRGVVSDNSGASMI